MTKEFHVTSDQAGRRLDRLLRAMWPQVPLGAVMKAIRRGDVRLDAKKTSPDARLEEGQFIQVPWNDEPHSAVTADQQDVADVPEIDTIYRDEYIWIVNKPAGLLTQPETKYGDSLITRALAELKWSRTDFHPSTVQRLDRNTSGAVIIAMTGISQRCISELIRERKIKKIYRAVVSGDIPDNGEINMPLIKDEAKNIVKPDIAGQSALTRYKKIGGDGKISTLEIELVTGRSHQARVHMSAIGHPILGDRKYGGDAKNAKRPLLHAYSVTFPCDARLPENLRGASFTAVLPDDMKKFFYEM